MFNKLRLRLRAIFFRSGLEDELESELRFHLQKEIEENIARGMSPEEAQRAALRSFGGVQRIKEESRDQRGVRLLEEGWQDLRYGARMLWKNPGFTLVVLLTLGLGIGANTAIFSVINAAMLRQLPYRNAARLVRLNESNAERGWSRFSVSHPNFLDWRARNQSFEALAATIGESYNLNAGGEVEVVQGAAITADFLPALGVAPALGRNFLPGEDRPGGDTRVVILAHGFWQRRFGGDRAVVGKTLQISDNAFTVVGVAPESFNWGVRNELFTPLAPDPAGNRGNHNLQVIGRLNPGVTLEHGLADLNAIARQLTQQYPESNRGWSVTGQMFYDWIVPEQSRRALLVFAGAVIFVLLIACGNVANLLLARGAARRKELAIRLALGAGRGRIIRQLLSESLLLALVAGALGLLVALWAVETLKTLNPATLPRLNELSVDGRVLAFGLLISLITAALFGLFPALQASRLDVHEMLKEGGRSGASGRQHLRSALVIIEAALSVALLIGAGLLLRSFAKLQDVELGFKPENLLTLRINLPRSRYPGHQESWAFYTRLLRETKALPGVQDAALTSSVPLSGLGNTGGEVQIPGRAPAADGPQPSAAWRLVSPGYWRTLGVPLRGRDFDERDGPESRPVTIISEEMARRYWPGEDPLGKTVTLRSLGNKTYTIIGVAGDVRSLGLDTEPGPTAYVSTAVMARAIQSRLVVRTRAEPTAQTAAVRGVLRSIDANAPVSDIQTIEQLLYASLGSRRFNLFLLGSFAAVALLLASIGLFGVMAYLASQRRREIGVRLALGAHPRDVFRLVIGRGMLLATMGATAGLLAAFGLARYLETLLFQVNPHDGLAFTAAPALLLGVALLACYLPARRAMKVDPLIALRHE